MNNSTRLVILLSNISLVSLLGLSSCNGGVQVNAKAAGEAQATAETQATDAPPTTEKTHEEGHDSKKEATCPMKVAGTQVTAEDTADGVALVFTTTGDVSEVQKRVHGRAELHNSHHSPNAKSGAAEEDEDEKDEPVSTATVQDLPNGAKLILTPADAADLDMLRSMVRKVVEKMNKVHGGS